MLRPIWIPWWAVLFEGQESVIIMLRPIYTVRSEFNSLPTSFHDQGQRRALTPITECGPKDINWRVPTAIWDRGEGIPTEGLLRPNLMGYSKLSLLHIEHYYYPCTHEAYYQFTWEIETRGLTTESGIKVPDQLKTPHAATKNHNTQGIFLLGKYRSTLYIYIYYFLCIGLWEASHNFPGGFVLGRVFLAGWQISK